MLHNIDYYKILQALLNTRKNKKRTLPSTKDVKWRKNRFLCDDDDL